MQYALIDGIRREPFAGGKGICPLCFKAVVAKCGQIKLHHWAHEVIKDCDSWHENETEWHRQWKNKFPENFREIPFTDEQTGEIHRADIHTPKGITIEFQNSSISLSEVQSRDNFYKKLIWVINGIQFKNNFNIQESIPNPMDKILEGFDFSVNGLVLYKKSDLQSNERMIELFGLNSEVFKSLKVSERHFKFSWKNPRTAWLETNSIVFFDFGCENLYLLKRRNQIENDFFYLQKFDKADFIKKYSIF